MKRLDTRPDARPTPSPWHLAVAAGAIEVQRARARACEALFGERNPVRVGRYEIEERLGHGGMGVVYRAYDPGLQRKVAIKLVQPGHSALLPELARKQLRAEARALAHLDSPYVVKILDVGDHDGQVYFAMDLIAGTTLATWLDRQTRAVDATLDVFMDAARGLADAHALGMSHRDFKPSNVLVSTTQTVHLIDFGLASLRAAPGASPPGAGTPAYMAPEVRAGQEPDARSDQYSFCVSLAEALGLRPGSEPRSTGRVRPALRRCIERGLAKEPRRRWPSMQRLLAELERTRQSPAWGRWAALGTATLVGGVLALSGGEPERAPCPEAASGTVWSDARRETLREAIGTRNESYAATVWGSADAYLDRYVTRWDAAHRLACESNATGSKDANALACLDARMDELDAVLVAFTAPTSHGVEGAVAALVDFDPPSRCLDVPTATSTNPARVAEFDELLAESHGWARAGRLDEAWSRALEAEAFAAELGLPGQVGQALLTRGKIALRRGDIAQARDLLTQAVFSAQRSQHDRTAASASTLLVHVVGVAGGDLEGGRTWARHATAAIDRADSPPDLAAELAHNLGGLELVAAQPERARKHFEDSLVQRERWFGADHARLAVAYNDLANAMVEARDYDAAARHFEEARQRWIASFGPRHPDVAIAWMNLGALADYRADYDTARSAYDEALEILLATLGSEHPRVAILRVNLGNTLYRLGLYEEARTHHERARSLYEKIDPAHSNLGYAHTGLGNIAADQEHHEEAWAHHQAALDVWAGSFGPDHPRVALAASNAAREAQQLGRLDEAEVLLRRSIRIREQHRGPGDVSLAFPLTILGRVMLERGDAEEAVASLERAARLRRSASDLDPRLLAATSFALAEAYWTHGDRSRALELARQARAAFDGPWAYAEQDVAMVSTWLSQHRA